MKLAQRRTTGALKERERAERARRAASLLACSTHPAIRTTKILARKTTADRITIGTGTIIATPKLTRSVMITLRVTITTLSANVREHPTVGTTTTALKTEETDAGNSNNVG